MRTTRDQVLELLKGTQAPLSGEAVSHQLGLSRTAVWKAVDALRDEGYTIEAIPSKGYRLTQAPDLLSAGELARPDHQVIYLEQVDSTNDECRRQAANGAPAGLVVIAGEQTRGKGRKGRSFQSLPGKGLYLSLLLRPQVKLEEVSQLTAWAAVSVCRALESLTGLSCAIKWTNDILVNRKKLCGILTELGIEAESGQVDYVVLGMGINVGQSEADFGELAPIAVSLAQLMEHPPRRAEVAAALLDQLDQLIEDFPHNKKSEYLSQYRQRCITTDQPVRLLSPRGEITAYALRVEDDFALRVRFPNGWEERVTSGEVSVRGLPGGD